jgi:hypothetical protein
MRRRKLFTIEKDSQDWTKKDMPKLQLKGIPYNGMCINKTKQEGA